MDPATLAVTAVSVVGGYLLKLGDAAAQEGAKTAAKPVFDWIKSKLTSAAGKEAVDKFERGPDKAGPKLGFQGQLLTWLEENPDAAVELQKLLAAAPGGGGGQTANFTGSGNKVNQVKGDNNSISS